MNRVDLICAVIKVNVLLCGHCIIQYNVLIQNILSAYKYCSEQCAGSALAWVTMAWQCGLDK